MKKEDLVAKGLTPEQADAVLAIYTEELKGFIPKSRFDEVNDAKKELTTQLADRDKQLKDLKDSAKDSEALTAKITELEEANKQTKETYEAKIKDMRLTAAIKEQLTDCKYPDLVADKFDRSKLILAEDGTVSGLTDQLKAVKETYKELFTPGVAGRTPDHNGNTPPGSNTRAAELQKILNDPNATLPQRISAQNELFELSKGE